MNLIQKRGEMKKPYFVAEIGSNHNQDMDRIKKLIASAKESGFDAVKFQLFTADTLYHPSALNERSVLKDRELDPDFLYHIDIACAKEGIDFICTPFSIKEVELIQPYVSAIKISSYELLRAGLIIAAAKTGLPIQLSTGMANKEEIRTAILTAKAHGAKDITIYHCNANYPATPENCCMSMLRKMRDNIKCLLNDADFDNSVRFKFGWSDHTCDRNTIRIAVLYAAVEMIEMHYDLSDGKGYESSYGHCWGPGKAKHTIDEIDMIQKIIGNPDVYQAKVNHIENRAWRADPSDGLRPMKEIRK